MPLRPKPQVIEYIFLQRFDPATGALSHSLVDSTDLRLAIEQCNNLYGLTLSTANPANFFKDYLRSPSRNADWPPTLAAQRITARQVYGNRRIFEFVPYDPGQNEPFPDEFPVLATDNPHPIESVSLNSDARALGRPDEAWLIQVCVHQRVLQTHFALYSPLDVVDVFHLQNSLKATPEIDAVFLLTFRENDEKHKALVTLEAKRNEPVLRDQIKSQVAYMADQCGRKDELKDIRFIIPVAARSGDLNGERVVTVYEMEKLAVAEGAARHAAREQALIGLKIEQTISYKFRPKVSGI